MRAISQYLLTESNMAHVVAYFLLGLIVIFLAISIIRSRFFPRSYKGIKFNTRNIAYIALMTAVSATVTIVISMTIPITVFPPFRVAFEGIMVKIAGMFFGPAVGIIVGLITELITIMFVPSYIHIAYLLTMIGFGFFSGIASYATFWKGNKKWYTFLIVNLFLIIYGIVMFFITRYYDDDIMLFGNLVNPATYEYIFLGTIGASLLVVWIVTGFFLAFHKAHLLETVFPIILLCVVTEYLITTLLGAWGDSGFLGIPKDTGAYSSILLVRLVQSPIKVGFNTLVLSTIFYVLKPLVKVK